MMTKSYIRAWADEKNRVEVIDLQKGVRQTTSIENASVVSYAYRTEVVNQDLEQVYSRIEGSGVDAINHLLEGGLRSEAEQDALLAFLDMFRIRGLNADRAEDRFSAVVFKDDLTSESVELRLGDMLHFANHYPDAYRPSQLALKNWPWHVVEVSGGSLSTGDAALNLWKSSSADRVGTITFPLAPTKLLVIGEELSDSVMSNFHMLNYRLEKESRRWLIGVIGSFKLEDAHRAAAERDATHS